MNHAEQTEQTTVLEAAETLARAILASPEWRELVSAQTTAEQDSRLPVLLARYRELSCAQRDAQETGETFRGTAMVELLMLRDQIQRHELYVRQQEAGGAVVGLLQRINRTISEPLGLDFASSAAPSRGGCCG